ncbi:magnesium transporter CorA family protein [Planctomicrobium piriforme]|uniref:magnesium transporter CorA family protein n=1 Tax=Planctomicrobium piriforme TaxID=1576369 RepID=UPI0015871080|nr:magnesium transporter CorA family protein [Planctomicrobium piriforme]
MAVPAGQATAGNGLNDIKAPLPMRLRVFKITDEGTLELLPDQKLHASWQQDPVQRWIDIERPGETELADLLAPLGLPNNILKACLDPARTVRFISRRNAIYMEVAIHPGWDRPIKPYISVLCLKTTIITIHRDIEGGIDDHFRDLDSDSPFLVHNTLSLLYFLMVEIGARNVEAALDVREEAEAMEQATRADPITLDPRRIAALRQRVSHCAAVHDNNAYCAAALGTVENEVVHASHPPAIARETVRLSEMAGSLIEGAEAKVAAVQQEYELAVQHRLENRLRFLTIISAVFLPLTLISAVYGMNFNDLPAMHWEYGYLVVIGMMLTTAGVTGAFLYWRGWFE